MAMKNHRTNLLGEYDVIGELWETCAWDHCGENIVKFAGEHSVSLIVMGSRGLGTTRQIILGSVIDYVLHHARCPITICKPIRTESETIATNEEEEEDGEEKSVAEDKDKKYEAEKHVSTGDKDEKDGLGKAVATEGKEMTDGRQIPAALQVVLIAIDGSGHADAAFRFYMENLHTEGNRLLLLYHGAYKPKFSSEQWGTLTFEQWEPYVVSRCNNTAEMKNHRTELLAEYAVSGELWETYAWDKYGEIIVKFAEENKASLIVMGSPGLGTARQTILGSVNDYVLHHAHCSVTICKPITTESETMAIEEEVEDDGLEKPVADKEEEKDGSEKPVGDSK